MLSKLQHGIGRFLFRRKQELRKTRDWFSDLASRSRVRRELRRAVRRYGLRRARSIVVFFTSEVDRCNGGVISIASLAAVSRRLVSDAAVVCSLYPDVLRYERCRNTTFPNDEVLIPFECICRRTRPERVLLHIPEFSSDRFHELFSERQLRWLKDVPSVHVNIMNQNILLMPPPERLDGLRRLADEMTQTTAHDRYATQEVCDRYGIPLHHFSTWDDTSAWPKVPFAQKEKVIAVSPDSHPRREEVLAMIARRLPDYRVVEIRDMTFGEYLQLTARSLFALTFGEGFDGYFVQPPVCGSLGFVVYNEDFFPGREWLSCGNVYATYDDLLMRFADDVLRLEGNEAAYEAVRRRQTDMLGQIYDSARFADNLRRFYAGEYDFLPNGGMS